MAEDYQVVLCSCPDSVTAQSIAAHVIDEGLAACVNILPGITSVYRWQGKRESTEESLLLIKTAQSVYDRLEQVIKQRHPYELPEIVAIPIQNGLPAYLNWLNDSLASSLAPET